MIFTDLLETSVVYGGICQKGKNPPYKYKIVAYGTAMASKDISVNIAVSYYEAQFRHEHWRQIL
jgi:hypothetical protein